MISMYIFPTKSQGMNLKTLKISDRIEQISF